jgi:ribonuclease HII
MLRPPRAVVRRDAGLYTLERTLHRRGFARVGGADEAGRGACAGPLVTAAVVLPPGRRGEVPGLADSKLLTPAAREEVYAEVMARASAYAVVIVPAPEVDDRGLHKMNLEALRRALGRLNPRPDYVLTDGFRVDGVGVPGLAVWKGDQVSACIAAASVLAKVTRDRIMIELDARYPEYEFAQHKGYVTPVHAAALRAHGPCPEHRMSYRNVAAARDGRLGGVLVGDPEAEWIELEPALAELGGASEGGNVLARVAVRDNGPVEDVTA